MHKHQKAAMKHEPVETQRRQAALPKDELTSGELDRVAGGLNYTKITYSH